MSRDLGPVTRAFQIGGVLKSAQPLGNGHINETFLAAFEDGGETSRFVVQRINSSVFKSPSAVMENVQRVLAHLSAKLSGVPDAKRRALTLIPARDGMPFHRDEEGEYWRCYLYISGGRTFDTAQSPRQAYEAARAFGGFQALLADLPAPRLRDTIPDFHNTPKRLEALEAAAVSDRAGRLSRAAAEVDFARRRASVASLLHGNLPERIVHNDTKLNNVIMDDATGEGLCVVDLDTVMPGLSLHDFGDMVRACGTRAAEDERDLSKVEVEPELFESLARGYMAGAGPMLTPEERDLLPVAGQVLAFELGLRFLADFLNGDAYFKVHRQDHNLDRARAQFKLARSFSRQESVLRRIVETAALPI
jgi:Ser/Thr protein kinase RdoA (MazF antagonist)